MKKLTEWIIGVNILSVLWLALLFNKYDSNISKEHFFIIQFLPIISLIIFGVSIPNEFVIIAITEYASYLWQCCSNKYTVGTLQIVNVNDHSLKYVFENV